MLRIFAAAFSYAAALVGAGFASGQEIVSFFVKYGKMSIIGVAVSAAVFGIYGALAARAAMSVRAQSFSELTEHIMPCRVQKIFAWFTCLFSLMVVCVMAACMGELLYTLTGVKRIWGTALMSLMCLVMLLSGVKGALKANAVMGAVIVVGVTAFGLYLLGYREHQAMAVKLEPVIAAAAYPGYNLITVGTVVVGVSGFLRSKNEARAFGAVSAVMMGVMMAAVWAILSIYYGKIDLGALPMLTLARRQSEICGMVYALIVGVSVLTTAAANGLCAAELLGERLGKRTAAVLVSMSGAALGTVGFARLIDTAYRWCGYAGIAMVAYVLVKCLKFLIFKEKQRF